MSSISTENAEALAVGPAVVARPAARFSSRRAYAQTFAATAAIRCLGVVSGVMAARLLGPAGRGELAVIIFLPMLLVPFGELELPRSLAYEVSRVEEVPRGVMATSFWLAAGLGLALAGLLAGLLPLVLPGGASRWFMVYLPATLITATLLGSDQGRGRFGRFSALLALPGALYLAGIVAAWASGHVSPGAFAAGLLVATLVVCGVRTQMDWGALSPRLADWTTARRLLQRGWSFYLPTVASIALYRADMFILVRLAPNEAIGLYAVAQAIALGQIGAVNPFVQVGFSAVAGETDAGRALKTLARHFRLAQLAVMGVGLVAAAATPWLVRLMFGAQFAGAVTTAYLLIGATVVWGMEQVLEQGLRAAGHPRPGIVSNLLGLGVLVGAGVPACVHYGIVGLAAAALGAQVLNLAVLIGFCVVGAKMSPSQLWAFNGSHLKELRSSGALAMEQVYAGARRFGWGARP
ncbi:MAG: lipopolysaccharide biosynthesis protein [Acidobacteriia bacterium]|nr:lipopolysaccharide biosynthesis protein [Terriglobia bacterium]